MSDETVRIHVSIDISTEEDADTGITVEAWNAMTEDERRQVSRDLWDAAAQRDNGGMWVITAGAEEI